MTDILIEGATGIRHLELKVPEDGGVLVLNGRNGSGKSKALDAVDKLIRGKGSIERSYGSPVAGKVSGFGATITVGNRTTRSGHLEVVSLADRLSLEELVDPGLKDPEAADAKRIKALLSLTGAASSGAFVGLPISESLLKGLPHDIVDAGAELKRRIESTAREAEAVCVKARATRDAAQANADAAAEAVKGADLKGGEDGVRKRHVEAVRQHESLKALQKVAEEDAHRRKDAQAEMDAMPAWEGPTAEEAVRASEAATSKELSLEQQLRLAQAEALEAEAAARLAETHERSEAKLRTILDECAVTPPTDDKLAGAAEDMEFAERDVQLLGKVKDYADAIGAAKGAGAEAEAAGTTAHQLRTVAEAIDGILSAQVQVEGLSVQDGRLVASRGDHEEYFAKLSAGERYSIALPIGIDQVGEGGVIVISQEAWEGLDPTNRATIHGLAREGKVTVLTAEATDGELTVAEYDANDTHQETPA